MKGVGRKGMTKDEAVEKCVRAMLKRQGYNENHWRSSVRDVDLARKIVAALEALNLLKLSSK